MLLDGLLAAVNCRYGRAAALGLLVVLVILVPLAGATPPDPLWIAGIYDAADSDDVVVAAMSLDIRVEHDPVVVSPVSIVDRIPVGPVPAIPDVSLRGTQARAPPTS